MSVVCIVRALRERRVRCSGIVEAPAITRRAVLSVKRCRTTSQGLSVSFSSSQIQASQTAADPASPNPFNQSTCQPLFLRLPSQNCKQEPLSRLCLRDAVSFRDPHCRRQGFFPSCLLCGLCRAYCLLLLISSFRRKASLGGDRSDRVCVRGGDVRPSKPSVEKDCAP